MLGLELGAIGKLAGLAAAAGGMVSGGLDNIELKDVADLGGKIAEAFEGEKRARLFSNFAKRVEDEVRRAIAERARSPRNRSPEIVAQNLRHALQRFAVALEKLHVSQADFVAADLDRMKVADRLLDKLAALEPCFREGDENREARPLAHEILRRSFEVATLDKSFLDNLLSAADAELLRRTTGLALRLDRVEEKVETGFARNDAAHAITQATLQELLVAVRGQVSPGQRASITRETLLPIVEALELAHVPEAQWPGKVMEAVGGLLAKQNEAVAPRNLGGDVDEALREARAVAPDTERAVGILRDRRAAIREEREARARAEAALLVEEADFLSLTYRHREAQAALVEATLLNPDDPWLWFRRGDLHRLLGATAAALDDFREGGEVARRVGDERSLSASFDRVGDIQMVQGDLQAALQSYRQGLAIARWRVSSNPGDAECMRDMAISLDGVGRVRMAQGDFPGALRQFRAMRKIAEALVRSGSGQDEPQQDLAFACYRIGDGRAAQGRSEGALISHRKSLAIRERLAAADPDNTDRQSDLSASLDRVGDMLMVQGDVSGALASCRKAHAIRQRLAVADPDNAARQMELSCSFSRIALLETDQGDLSAALDSFRAGLEIAERQTAADPGNTEWQRDLSVLLDGIARLQSRSDALESYRAGLVIAERLASSDPSNAGWQRDLSISLARVGNMQLREGDIEGASGSQARALTIAENLVSCDPDNLETQRFLCLALERFGEVQVARDDLTGGLTTYYNGLAIARRLAAAYHHNAAWRDDLPVLLELIGETHVALGDFPLAAASFSEAIALRRQLAFAEPHNTARQLDLIMCQLSLADICAEPGAVLGEAHALARQLSAEGRLAPADTWMLEATAP